MAKAAVPFFPPPDNNVPPPELFNSRPTTEYVLPGSSQRIPAAQGLTADEARVVALFETNKESVVNITNVALARDRYSLNLFEIPAGTGSGFIWDVQGHIVTNFHVVKGASSLQVTLLDQTTWPAKVIGVDPDKDVAVLQLQADAKHMNSLKPVTIGSSSSLLVGQKIYAIGQPFGLDHSLTSGLVSGLGRELGSGNTGRPIKNIIQVRARLIDSLGLHLTYSAFGPTQTRSPTRSLQTRHFLHPLTIFLTQVDAAINPGNSGGPLLDSSGRVVGVNTAILDPSGRGSFTGVGLAVPIDAVDSSVRQILTYGRVARPSLGVTIGPQTVIRQSGLRGVLVYETARDGPADKAGLRGTYRSVDGIELGDIITGINGKPVASAEDLYSVLDDCKVGQTVTVDFLRDGEKRGTARVTLVDRSQLMREGSMQAE